MTDSLNQTTADELQRKLDIALRQRDQLANAIAEAAIKSGGVSEGVNLTGPQLTMLVDDMAHHIQELEAKAHETAPVIEYNMLMGDAANKYCRSFGDFEPKFPATWRWHALFDEMIKHTKTPVMTAGLQPNFEAVKDARIGDLTPNQLDDATELWLRNQSGWFKDQEYLDFLLYRLDQARGKAPFSKPSQLGLSHRPGGVETSAWDANGPTLNEHMEALARDYGTLKNGLVTLCKNLGLPALSNEMTLLGPDNHQANIILTDQLGTLMGVDFTQHPEPRGQWGRPYTDLTGNPAFATLSAQYRELADRLVTLAQEAGGESASGTYVVDYPIQRQDANNMLWFIRQQAESRVSGADQDQLGILSDDDDEDEDEAASISPR